MKEARWEDCYSDSWQGLIVPEAFAHPAKMARGLIKRIFDHLIAEYSLRPGATIVDCFGGIGTTAIEGASRGMRVTCVELEPRFCALARANFELHRATWDRFGDPQPVMIQGDSRRLAEILAGAECVVSSPPFAKQMNEGGDTPAARGIGRNTREQRPCEADGKHNLTRNYGDSPGQLQQMELGDVSLVLSSPPYAETAVAKSSDGVDLEKQYVTYRSQGGGASFEKFVATQAKHSAGYGSTQGNLAGLQPGEVAAVVTSSPFCESLSGKGECPQMRPDGTPFGQGKSIDLANYGVTPGQLANARAGKIESVLDLDKMESDTQRQLNFTGTSGSDGANSLLGITPSVAVRHSEDTRCQESTISTTPAPIAEELNTLVPTAASAVTGESLRQEESSVKNRRKSKRSLSQESEPIGGKVDIRVGEVQVGNELETDLSDGVDLDASDVELSTTSGDTTSKTRKRQVGSGTTGTKTSCSSAGSVTTSCITINDSEPITFPKTQQQTTSDYVGLTASERSTAKLSIVPVVDPIISVAPLASDSQGSVADAIVSSPPFEQSDQRGSQQSKVELLSACHRDGKGYGCNDNSRYVGNDYGNTQGQLGNSTGQTFWEAFAVILEQCHLVLCDNGLLVLVCKDFIRKGVRVPFSADTVRLAESRGFRLVEWIKASLVKEVPKPDLFGGPQTREKKKVSFFRRLAEKRGAPRIDEEDCLIFRRV